MGYNLFIFHSNNQSLLVFAFSSCSVWCVKLQIRGIIASFNAYINASLQLAIGFLDRKMSSSCDNCNISLAGNLYDVPTLEISAYEFSLYNSCVQLVHNHDYVNLTIKLATYIMKFVSGAENLAYCDVLLLCPNGTSLKTQLYILRSFETGQYKVHTYISSYSYSQLAISY